MASLPVLLASGDTSPAPDSFMPSLMVEIAFTSGYTTPAADRVWTDVSSYVELHEGIGIDFGRQDERSTAGANSLSLTLDNTDGRFTAGRSASPYYPDVKIGRPIRVSATLDGYTSIRFVGFVDEWPVEWDGSDAYASATIRASSRLARLGLTAKLRSMPEEDVLLSRPLAYWTLGDAAGAVSAVESSGNAGAALSRFTSGATPTYPVVFGNATGPGTDGLTAAEFAAAADFVTVEALRAEVPLPAGTRWLRASVRVTDAGVYGGDAVTTSGFSLSVSPSGVVSGPATTGPNIDDGLTHDLVLAHDGTTETLYVDGVAVDTSATAPPAASTFVYVGAGLGCVMAHVAVGTTIPTAARVAAQAQAMQTSYAERTDQRALRLLGWAGVPATEVTAETGAETVTYQQTSGQSVVDALREVESTEGGVLFDGRDGNVTFHNRSRRYLATPAATLDMAAQHVGADYAPKLDRSTLVNDVEVSNPTTGEKARSTDTTSSDEYGVATGSATSVASAYDPLQQKAGWLITSYAEPRSRVPSLTVDVLAHQGLTPSAQTLLGLTAGDLLAVTNAPAQADTTSPSYFVEGGTEDIGPESYSISFNLSPAYPTLNTFVLDSATRGVLDTSILAY